MIRVVYRGSLEMGKSPDFQAKLTELSDLMTTNLKGAKGILMLANHNDPTDIMIVSHWESFEDWLVFYTKKPPEFGKFRELFTASDNVKIDLFDELLDLRK